MRKPIKPHKPTLPNKYLPDYKKLDITDYDNISFQEILNKIQLSISNIELDQLNIEIDRYYDDTNIVVTYRIPIENKYYEKELKEYTKKKKEYDKKLKKYKTDLEKWQKWKDKNEKDKRKKIYDKLKKEFEFDEFLKRDHDYE